MKIIKTLLVGLALISAISCNKYEAGPAISFVSKTRRITQSWDYAAVYRNGLDITNGLDTSKHDYSESRIGFAEDNRFSYFNTINGVEFIGDGFWEFTDNNEKLKLIFEDSSATKIYTITRLAQSFLWFEEELENNVTLEFQLIPHN